MAERCVHVLVSGRVQGVGYRAFAARAGRALGLRGWVRNRDDGAVEALAAGDSDRIGAFIARLQQGPALARVDDCRVREDQAPPASEGFEIRY